MLRISAFVLTATLLTACQNGAGYDANQNTYKGAGLGALIGGVTGAATGKGDDRVKRGAIGAGIGALAAGAVGQYMDRQENQMRQELQGTGIDVKRQGDEILLNMPNSITFGFDSSNVRSEFGGTLNDIAQVLNQYPQTNIEVIGGDEYNKNLSVKRAQAVTSQLISRGVVANRLYAIGMGESNPVASNSNEAGRAQNRRVEVKISPVVQQ